MNEIIPGLYIGDQYMARNVKSLRDMHIGAIVNCTPDVPNTLCNEIEYMRLTVDDSMRSDDFIKMQKYFMPAIWFIYKNHDLEKKRVLVHCHAGMQRSAIVVAAYLVYFHNATIKQAIQHIVSKRPICFLGGSNVNFLPSLIEFTGGGNTNGRNKAN